MPQLPFLVLALAFAALPSNAALFPKKSNVQQVDHTGFRNALKEDMPFVTAFVAPWCGHCKKLAPELVRVADGLHPLIPIYAVDCDDSNNRPVCAEQGVKGFPTIKLFPHGKKSPPLEFDGTRSASSIFYWASRAVPGIISRVRPHTAEGISEFLSQNSGKLKAVLLNKSNKTPLLWRVLSNKYGDKIVFANCRDRKGKVSVELGYEVEAQSKAKILLYGRDSTTPVRYEGVMKFASFSKFFDEIIDGTIDLSRPSVNTRPEVPNTPTSEDLDDETRIGDAGYAGFNPHEGLDMEEFLKRGIPNPHAPGHPGASKPSTSDLPRDDESTSFPAPNDERSSAKETQSAETETVADQSKTAAEEEHTGHIHVESGKEHTKDEL